MNIFRRAGAALPKQEIKKPEDKPRIQQIPQDRDWKLAIILLVAGLILGPALLLGAVMFTSLSQSFHVDTNILDGITIVAAALALLEGLFIMWLYKHAGDTTWQIIKASTGWPFGYNSFAIAGILEPDGRISLRAADIDPDVGSKWLIPKGKIYDEKRLANMTQLNGPDRIDYAFWTSEGLSSLDMQEKANSELFGTSAYVAKTGDLREAKGYIEGHEDSKNTGFENFFRENWMLLMMIAVGACIGIWFMWDKIVTSPAQTAGWVQCEQRYSQLSGLCGRAGVNVAAVGNVPTGTTLPPHSSTGGAVTS